MDATAEQVFTLVPASWLAALSQVQSFLDDGFDVRVLGNASGIATLVILVWYFLFRHCCFLRLFYLLV